MALTDYRVDPFSGAPQYVKTTGEKHTIPTTAPYRVKLSEIPQFAVPSLTAVRAPSSPVDHAGPSGADVNSGSPNTVYSNPSGLTVGHDASSYTYRGLLQWNISGWPNTIDSAVLHFAVSSGTAVNTLQVNEVTQTWDPTTVTFNNQPGIEPTPEGSVTVGTGAWWYSIDITALVKRWLASSSPDPNYGLEIRAAVETVTATTDIYGPAAASADQPFIELMVQGSPYTEVPKGTLPAAGQYRVDYDASSPGTGTVEFNASDNGSSVVVDFTGTGSLVDVSNVGSAFRQLAATLASNGALTVAAGATQYVDGVQVYDSVTLNGGSTLTTHGPLPMLLICLGDFICPAASIVGDGKGYAGGAGGAYASSWAGRGAVGQGPTGGRGGDGIGTAASSLTAGHGGGGGNAARGSSGAAGSGGNGGDGGEESVAPSGYAYPFWLPPSGGGGGGGGANSATSAGGDGKAGGAGINIVVLGHCYIGSAAALSSTGVQGAAGGVNAGNGGSGAGGYIWILADANRDIRVTPTVTGGAAQGSAGAGAAGWYKFDTI